MQRAVKQKEPAGLRHLTSREKAALSEFVVRLREKYADEVMLVVLVVVEGEDRWPYWREITDLTSDLLLDYEVNMSALVFDEEHYQWLMEHRTPIYNNTAGKGVFVWMKKRGESSSGYA